MSISAVMGFNGTYEEYVEYIGMCHIKDGETSTEWKNRIQNRLIYFQNKKYYTYGEKDCFYAHKALPYLKKLVNRWKICI